jgi:hypothetical protein
MSPVAANPAETSKPIGLGAVQASAEKRLIWSVLGGSEGLEFYLLPEYLPLPFFDSSVYRLISLNRTEEGYLLSFRTEGDARPFLDPGTLVGFRPNAVTDVSVYYVASITWSRYTWTKDGHLTIHLDEKEQYSS